MVGAVAVYVLVSIAVVVKVGSSMDGIFAGCCCCCCMAKYESGPLQDARHVAISARRSSSAPTQTPDRCMAVQRRVERYIPPGRKRAVSEEGTAAEGEDEEEEKR